MSVRKILIGLGIFVALLPYLGLPSEFDTLLSTLVGLVIVALLLIRKSAKIVDAVDTAQVRPSIEKELRVKHSAGKSTLNTRTEKSTGFDAGRGVVASPQKDPVLADADMTAPNLSTNATRVQTSRTLRQNKL
jgi:hypothetical protein